MCGLSLHGALLDQAEIGNTFRRDEDVNAEAADDFFNRQYCDDDF